MNDEYVPQPLASLASGDAEKVNAYLAEQTTLIQLQVEDMRRDDAIRHRALRVHHASELVKLALELAVALAVLIAAAAFAAAIWFAAHADGLVVEPFSIPPDLINKGLTGEVVATKVLDRLAALQARTASNRAASSYANNWGNDIKVQIPDTGVSLGEFNRLLHSWLGHETHIAGEIYRTASGNLAIAARTGGKVSPVFIGTEADFDKLIGQAAEAVYRETQPYRYAVYLSQQNRGAEASTIYRQLIRSGPAADKPWAYIGLATLQLNKGKFEDANRLTLKAAALKPNMLFAWENLAASYNTLDRDEQALAAIQKAIALARNGRDPEENEDFFAVNPTQDLATRALLGNSQAVLMQDDKLLAWADHQTWETAYQNNVQACGALHDRRCLAQRLAVIPASSDPFAQLSRQAALQSAYILLEDWRTALSLAPSIMTRLSAAGEIGQYYIRHGESPFAALAHAGTGDFLTANRLIADSPLDCYKCVRFRGRIAAMQQDWPSAEKWFRHAAILAPSMPFAYADWGQALLKKGDVRGAIAKFATAHAKSPHFADPVEMWGEALMMQNRSDLAIAKFEEAARAAPHWGHLHLKWGEALMYVGRKDDASKQLALAAYLDLTPAEHAELSKVHRHR